MYGGIRMAAEEQRPWAVGLLQKRQEQLGRTPQKADFDEVTRSRIKAFLGPWPRALEAVGLKEPRARQAKPHRRKQRTP